MVEPKDPHKTFNNVIYGLSWQCNFSKQFNYKASLYDCMQQVSENACINAFQADYYSHPEHYSPVFHELPISDPIIISGSVSGFQQFL